MLSSFIKGNFTTRLQLWPKGIKAFSQNVSQPIAGVRLSFKKYSAKRSDKEPIIILHGLFGNKTNWNSIAKALNMNTMREVYCVDLRNHGESPHSPDMTYEHMARDLEIFIQENKLPAPVIIGHSMGGRVAMYLSLTKPAALSRLCVIDISPLFTSPSLRTMRIYLEILSRIKIPKGMNLSDCRKHVDKALTPTIEDPRLRSFLVTNLDAAEGDVYWRVNLPVLKDNFEREIAIFPDFTGERFVKPTLFIAGSRSDYIKPETTMEIRTLYPNTKFVFIEGAGHWVHVDQPAAFIDAIVSFL